MFSIKLKSSYHTKVPRFGMICPTLTAYEAAVYKRNLFGNRRIIINHCQLNWQMDYLDLESWDVLSPRIYFSTFYGYALDIHYSLD